MIVRYNPITKPTEENKMPKPQNKCIGLAEYCIQNLMINKSKKPFNNLATPYFDWPYLLGWCFTFISPILNPFHFNKPGINLCISPYKSKPLKHSFLYAFNVHPESCILTFVNFLTNKFENFEGIFFSKESFLLILHPLTTSYPSSIFSNNRGISSGSFCKSASMVIIIMPLEFLKPASKAAVCPKFFLNLMIFTLLSFS